MGCKWLGWELVLVLVTSGLAHASTVTVRLTDEQGEPLVGASVELELAGATFASTTDAQGRARFEDLEVGSCTVRATLPWHAPLVKTFPLKAERSVSLSASLEVLGPGWRLSLSGRIVGGLVLDARTGALLEGVTVSMPLEELTLAVHTDQLGRFEFDDGVPGQRLEFVKAGYRPAERRYARPEGSAIQAVVLLEPEPSAGSVELLTADPAAPTPRPEAAAKLV